MKIRFAKFSLIVGAVFFSALAANAQSFRRELTLTTGAQIEIVNDFGRVDVVAEKPASEDATEINSYLTANAGQAVADAEVKISNFANRLIVEVAPADAKKRIDLALHLPERATLKIETGAGEVRVAGDFAKVEVRTDTGTIAADVPLDNLSYNFLWTASRPRFISDVELDEVEEKSAGKFVVSGKITKDTPKSKFSNSRPAERVDDSEASADASEENGGAENSKDDEKEKKDKPKKVGKIKINGREVAPAGQNKLNFSTARGIVLLNINPNEVPSDLRERPLTNAAKAIIRSGDSILMEAIRRASPKYFGEYAETLPPLKFEPSLNLKTGGQTYVNSTVKKVLVRVTDMNNRALADLKKDDFQVTERGTEREILAVEPTSAPFNLVLLLDVSGSVENYVDFIRKAARAFVQTADRNDRIAIIIFNEDVKQVSKFTTDKGKLSESLDTFDAGGGTAYYDSLAYTISDTLRPLRGERTAIVVLTDGDDNYSFLPFESLLGSLQESGALVYPLYVPSALVAASNADLNARIDPLRAKYMGLSTKAEGEGERLAQISGGIYYPITQLNQIQKAYDDIVLQLRTAYSVTFKSDLIEAPDKTNASPRLKVKVKRDNAFVKLGSVVGISNRVSEAKKN
ncbi:MAG TPA: VWA domain-containing protein [Pyrinomonadaceae bacterium]|jgi:VWFA-related protein